MLRFNRGRQDDKDIYQHAPRQEETYTEYPVYSWTSSKESYSKTASREAYCLFNNGRKANFTLQLNLYRMYFVQDIEALRKELSILFAYLRRKKKIAAYAVLEVTRDQLGMPTNKVHFHFLIDTDLSENKLKKLFHRACKSAGYTRNDYRLSKVDDISGKPDDEYRWLCKYIVKADRLPKKVILFKKHLRLRKTRTVGDFWLDANGDPTTKKAIWEPIRLATIRKHQE